MEQEIDRIVSNQIPDQVEELILDKWKGTQIQASEKSRLETFKNLAHLSMIGCGLKSLTNFPILADLLKLELSDNHIQTGLDPLSQLTGLMYLSLAGNQIANFEDLIPISQLENLLCLDLYGCPITNQNHYRETIFSMFQNVQILDGMDINGEEASLDSEDDEDEDDLEEDEEIKDFMVEDNPEDLENEENMVLLGQKRQRDFEIEEDTLQKRMR